MMSSRCGASSTSARNDICAAGRQRTEMSFADIAQVIGERLPRSAYHHPAR
jgi:hypothetical protein